MNAHALIGLGANLGDAHQTILDAVKALEAASGIFYLQRSRLYASDPVDAQGPVFINAVASIETTLAPIQLLDLLQSIENTHGRARPYRNAPRTLDLDLLLLGYQVVDTPTLTVPHPRLHLRPHQHRLPLLPRRIPRPQPRPRSTSLRPPKASPWTRQ